MSIPRTAGTIFLVLFLSLIAAVYLLDVLGGPDSRDLGGAEVREYRGVELSSYRDFRENSIRGPQQVDISEYRLTIDENSGLLILKIKVSLN